MGGSSHFFSKVNGQWQCQECGQMYQNVPQTLPLKLSGICQTCGDELHAKSLESGASMSKSKVQKSAKPVRKKQGYFQTPDYGTKAQNEVHQANLALSTEIETLRARVKSLDAENRSMRRMITSKDAELTRQINARAELNDASGALADDNERLCAQLRQMEGQLAGVAIKAPAPVVKAGEDEVDRALQFAITEVQEAFEEACQLIVAGIHTSDSDKFKDNAIGFLERHPPK